METYPIIKHKQLKTPTIYPESGLFKVATNDLERELAGKLSARFGPKILSNLKVGYYYPDISFIDYSNNIFIDIEIDEPYSKSGKPTHYAYNIEDTQRDTFFIKNGWNLIRFSENQVKNQIEKVVKTIILFHKSLVDNMIEELEDYIKNFNEPRWSYSDSLEYIGTYKRDYYSYQVFKIEENSETQIFEIETLKDLFKNIIDKHTSTFNYSDDIIFLPYFISNHHINHSNKTKLLFLNCLPSDGSIQLHDKSFTICHFSNYAKIELIDISDLDSFNYITERKKENKKIYVRQDIHDKYLYYDFFLIGTIKDYFESTLKFYPKI